MLIKYDGMICSKIFLENLFKFLPFCVHFAKKNAKYALSEIILPREVNLNTGEHDFFAF